jgi:hypothetical protein
MIDSFSPKEFHVCPAVCVFIVKETTAEGRNSVHIETLLRLRRSVTENCGKLFYTYREDFMRGASLLVRQ